MRLTTPEHGEMAGRASGLRHLRRAGGRMRGYSTILIAALIGLTPVAASATTIVEDFTVAIGAADGITYASSGFADFNPALGTLTQVSESVNGSTTWTVNGTLISLTVTALITRADNNFGYQGPIDIDITGSTTDPTTLGALTGTGVYEEQLSFDDVGNAGSLSYATLSGTITYTYTPATVPVSEPAPLAVLGAGLVGLMFIRRGSSPAK